MNEPTDINAVRNEALRKVGRNVVHFAKIEAGLKFLLLKSKIEGNPETIVDQFHKNKTKLRKQTLGSLVDKFNKDIMSPPSQSDPAATPSEREISLSFKVMYDNPDFLKAQRSALSNIVTERNKLIHQNLALLDTSSAEDCLELINVLDEQNYRLLAHLKELRWMIDSLRKMLNTAQEVFGATQENGS